MTLISLPASIYNFKPLVRFIDHGPWLIIVEHNQIIRKEAHGIFLLVIYLSQILFEGHHNSYLVLKFDKLSCWL